MSENREKSLKWTEGFPPSKKTNKLHKAIFAVREIFQDHVYQTRGMACAVDVGGSIRLVTWRGVGRGVADYNNVVMDRFSEKFFSNVQRYRLQKSTVRTYDSFSFLSVSYKDNFTILQYKVPGNEIKVSNLKAYSFLGEETIELEFEYNKSKKKHELVTTGGKLNWEKRVTEKTSLLGSPIIAIIGDDRAIVGVVGEDAGKIVPFFITEKEFDQEKTATEEEEKEKKDNEGGGAAAGNLDHQKDQMENAKSTSSQNELSSSSKDAPDANIDHQRDQVGNAKSTSSWNESSSSSIDVPDVKIVRSGAIPIQYLPYLALDIQSSTVGWTSLGRALEVAYLSGVSKDYDEDYERYYKMLKLWHQQSGSALYDKLEKALKSLDLCDIATMYCYQENDPPTQKNQKISGLKAGRVSNGDLNCISRAVEGRRKRLGRALGVSDDHIDSLVEQNRSDVSEQSYQILHKWDQMKGSEATYDALAQALLDRTVMMKAVMDEYCLNS